MALRAALEMKFMYSCPQLGWETAGVWWNLFANSHRLFSIYSSIFLLKYSQTLVHIAIWLNCSSKICQLCDIPDYSVNTIFMSGLHESAFPWITELKRCTYVFPILVTYKQVECVWVKWQEGYLWVSSHAVSALFSRVVRPQASWLTHGPWPCAVC